MTLCKCSASTLRHKMVQILWLKQSHIISFIDRYKKKTEYALIQKEYKKNKNEQAIENENEKNTVEGRKTHVRLNQRTRNNAREALTSVASANQE